VPQGQAALSAHSRSRRGPALRASTRARRTRCQCRAEAPVEQVQPQGHLARQVPAGEVSIGPMAEGEVGAAAVVLTRAFAESPQEALSYGDVSKFLASLLAVPPAKAQVLVARLAPTGAAGPVLRLRGAAPSSRPSALPACCGCTRRASAAIVLLRCTVRSARRA